MRNWNKEGAIKYGGATRVFTVPMRNWNLFQFALSRWIPGVFTVPMRNWNPQGNGHCLFWWSRFYSTYEELKHDRITWQGRAKSLFLQYLWGIETMVVISKKNKACMFLQYLWGIETSSSSIFAISIHPFLQYLWGIETKIVKKVINNEIVFLQYLWGIETRCKYRWWMNQYHVFTVPMRNWNSLPLGFNVHFYAGFYSTYEELKQENR